MDRFRLALDDPEITQVLCLLDITRLEKGLYLTLQAIRECERHGKQVLVLANISSAIPTSGRCGSSHGKVSTDGSVLVTQDQGAQV